MEYYFKNQKRINWVFSQIGTITCLAILWDSQEIISITHFINQKLQSNFSPYMVSLGVFVLFNLPNFKNNQSTKDSQNSQLNDTKTREQLILQGWKSTTAQCYQIENTTSLGFIPHKVYHLSLNGRQGVLHPFSVKQLVTSFGVGDKIPVLYNPKDEKLFAYSDLRFQ